ncbi:hypothetical protein SODG_000705 [Sodalis praecaptivus]
MFSTQKSRKILLITTILLLSSAGQPAFALHARPTPITLLRSVLKRVLGRLPAGLWPMPLHLMYETSLPE